MNLYKNILNKRLLYAFTLVGLMINTSIVFGQITPPARPAACTIGNGDGYLDLGEPINSPTASCSNFANPNFTVNIPFAQNSRTFTNVQYYFSIDNTFNTATPNKPATAAVAVGNAWSATKELTPGYHWFMITAEENGVKLKKCSFTEVISSIPPKVDYSICGTANIDIIILDDPANQHQEYVFNWGAGNVETVKRANITLPHKITRPNTGGQISVIGRYERIPGGFPCPTLPSKIDPAIPNVPVINYLELKDEGASAMIKFKNFTVGKKYKLEFTLDNGAGGSSWRESGDFEGGEGTIGGLDKTKTYCFRLADTDNCGTKNYSAVICSSNLEAKQPSSQSVDLTWNKPSQPSSIAKKLHIDKFKVGCTGTGCGNRPFVNVTETRKSESGLDCNIKYTYQLQYTFEDADANEIIIKSDLVEIDPKDGSIVIAPKSLVTLGYQANDDQSVQMIVQNGDATSFSFFRLSPGGKDFDFIAKRDTDQYVDIAIVSSAGEYCYKYSIEDVCGTESGLSPQFCTVFLSGNSSQVQWTPYILPSETFDSGGEVVYTLEKYDTRVNTWIPIEVTEDTQKGIFDIIINSKESEVKFRVQAKRFVIADATSSGQFEFSYSNTITIKVPPNVFLPTAFTPNNDGHNDVFAPFQRFIKEGSITIYDRWGAILFESSDLATSWDGSELDRSTPAPAGNYAFKISGISDAGEKFTKMGSITLLR